jgi:hypothetical protein
LLYYYGYCYYCLLASAGDAALARQLASQGPC